MTTPVGYKIRVKPEFVTADVKYLHDHSYATDDDDVRVEIKQIKETCQMILKNQSIIMKDIALIKQETNTNGSLNLHKDVDNVVAIKNKSPIKLEEKWSPVKKVRIKLPCSSVQEVEELEEKIQENEQFENFMIQYFERIQEYELPKFIKTAFQSVMTDEVARCFTWYGLNHNRCIKDFKLISILLEIASRKFTQAPKEITVNFMKKYFLMCKDRSRKKQINLTKTQGPPIP